MLKALLRVRFAALRSWLMGGTRSKKPPSRAKLIGFAALMIYAWGAIGFLFYGTFSALAAPYRQAGLDWLYFALFALLNFALIFIGSVFTAKAQLFEAKDNELLLSLPVPPSLILLSRMATLAVVNFFLELVTAIPCALAWCLTGPVNAGGVVGFALACLLLPLFALAVSALFGWLISLLTRRVRNQSLVSTLASLVFLGLYFWGYSRMNSAVSALAANGAAVAGHLGAVTPLVWLGRAMAAGGAADILLSCLALLLPFLLACWLLAATFIRTVTTRHGFARVKYRERRQREATPRAALFRRELARFTSSSAYMLNTGLGAVFLVAGGVALFFWGGRAQAFLAQAPAELRALAAPGAAVLACMIVGTAPITAPSVSLEGVNLWIARSLPVETADILRAKLRLHLTVMCPAAALASAGILTALRPAWPTALGCLLLPQAFTALTGLMGLMANLRHPSFDWTNETQAVKNGVSVLIALAEGWGVALVLGAAIFFLRALLPTGAVLLLLTALTLLACRLLYGRMLRRGVDLYEEL